MVERGPTVTCERDFSSHRSTTFPQAKFTVMADTSDPEWFNGERLERSSKATAGYLNVTPDNRKDPPSFSYSIPEEWHDYPGADTIITKGYDGKKRKRSATFATARDAAYGRAVLYRKLQESVPVPMGPPTPLIMGPPPQPMDPHKPSGVENEQSIARRP